MLVVLAGILGAPVAAFAYFFLKLVGLAQHFFYKGLVGDLGFSHEPLWWPLPLLVICGLLVALTIQYLPGTAGHKPAEGLKLGGTPLPIDLPGAFIAALATLALGAVLGPEAPLIFMGGGLGALAMRAIKRDAPQQAIALMGSAGSFAAISTLLGNPLVAAFLLLEAAGGAMGGPMLGPLLMPGLAAAGVGTLIFVGLDSWTGFGTFSLAIPHIPAFHTPTGAEFLWAIAIGIIAAALGIAIRFAALRLQGLVEPRRVFLTPAMGIIVALAAIIFCAISDKSSSLVLFSGQSSLPTLVQNAATFSAGTLVLLVACKGIAYMASLSSFRGGPVFPSMFIGTAVGIALSHLPGLPMIAGVAMGIGAMGTAMLGLPMTSVLLAALFVVSDAIELLPLIIISAVISYIVSARLAPAPAGERQEAEGQPAVGKPAAA